MKMTRTRYALACLGVVTLVACGGGSAAETTATTGAAPTESVIEVTAVDFGFENLPERIPAGTTLTLVNESDVELHELVAVRLPEDETRTVEELLASPEDLAAYFASVATVVIAPPGESGMAVEGTGRLDEPGRYAIVCAIPTGADPAEYMEAAAEAEGGPPEVDGGPPHFAHGMYAEVTVEG
jgi:plastocyanin